MVSFFLFDGHGVSSPGCQGVEEQMGKLWQEASELGFYWDKAGSVPKFQK